MKRFASIRFTFFSQSADLLIYRFILPFSNTTDRTSPVIRNLLKRSAGFNISLWIALFRIVNMSAYSAFVLLHSLDFLKVKTIGLVILLLFLLSRSQFHPPISQPQRSHLPIPAWQVFRRSFLLLLSAPQCF